MNSLERSKRNEKLHRELWSWLADNPSTTKWDWPRWRKIEDEGELPRNLCFACAEDSARAEELGTRSDCSNCPIIESCGLCNEDDSNNAWYQHHELGDPKAAVRFRDAKWIHP